MTPSFLIGATSAMTHGPHPSQGQYSGTARELSADTHPCGRPACARAELYASRGSSITIGIARPISHAPSSSVPHRHDGGMEPGHPVKTRW
jgi:hypothetical protein